MAWYGRDYGRGMDRGWGGGFQSDRFGAGRYDGGWHGRDRMTFRPRGNFRGGYDRDMGDQLREGWNDLKRGVRRAFGGGYDRSYHGDRGGYGYPRGNRGGYSGHGRGYDRGWFW